MLASNERFAEAKLVAMPARRHMVRAELCTKFFHDLSGQQGPCKFGDKCNFAHHAKQLNPMSANHRRGHYHLIMGNKEAGPPGPPEPRAESDLHRPTVFPQRLDLVVDPNDSS